MRASPRLQWRSEVHRANVEYILGGIVIIGGVILFPEVTIPAIGIGAAAQ